MTKKPISPHAMTFVLFSVFLDMVGFGLIIPVLPGLIEDVGDLNLADAAKIGGWMFFAFSVAQFAFSPLMGNLSDRFGRRPLLLLAIAGLGLDYVLQAFAPTLLWLFVGRIIAGICGSSWVIANAFITDVTTPEDRAKYFGLLGACFGLGFVIGPALGGLLGSFGPRVPFLVAATISGLNLIYGYIVLPETLAPEHRRAFKWRRANPFGVFAVFRGYQGVLPMCGVLFTYFFCSAIYPAIWAFWGMAKFDWSPSMVGVTLAAFGLVMAAFQGGLAGPAAARFGERRMVMFGLATAVVGLIGYGFAWGVLPVVVLMIIHGPEGFVHPMLTAMLTKNVPPDAQGELQGGLSAIMSVAMLLGTVVFSQIFGMSLAAGGRFATDIPFFIAGAGMAACLVMFMRIMPADAKKAQF
jgi:MFS transporter, DHA1 family, tetracycline resistance protein